MRVLVLGKRRHASGVVLQLTKVKRHAEHRASRCCGSVRPEFSRRLPLRVLEMGKKGKGKKVEFLTDDEALSPFGVAMNDIVATPLGVYTTVIGVKEGALWLKWPGGIESPASPAPAKARNKAELETYGYSRRPQSAHIQRSIDERLSVRGGTYNILPGRRQIHDAAARTTPDARPCSLCVCIVRRHSTSSAATALRAPGRQPSSCRWDRTALRAAPRLLRLLPAMAGQCRRRRRARVHVHHDSI